MRHYLFRVTRNPYRASNMNICRLCMLRFRQDECLIFQFVGQALLNTCPTRKKVNVGGGVKSERSKKKKKPKKKERLIAGSNPGIWPELPVLGRHLNIQAVYTTRHTPPIRWKTDPINALTNPPVKSALHRKLARLGVSSKQPHAASDNILLQVRRKEGALLHKARKEIYAVATEPKILTLLNSSFQINSRRRKIPQKSPPAAFVTCSCRPIPFAMKSSEFFRERSHPPRANVSSWAITTRTSSCALIDILHLCQPSRYC